VHSAGNPENYGKNSYHSKLNKELWLLLNKQFVNNKNIKLTKEKTRTTNKAVSSDASSDGKPL